MSSNVVSLFADQLTRRRQEHRALCSIESMGRRRVLLPSWDWRRDWH